MIANEQTKLEWVAAKLKERRLSRGLTLQRLANQVGLSCHARISDYENLRYIPTLGSFLAVLDALGTNPADFFKDMPPLKEIGTHRNAQ